MLLRERPVSHDILPRCRPASHEDALVTLFHAADAVQVENLLP